MTTATFESKLNTQELEIIARAASRTSRSFGFAGSKYAISLADADSNGIRKITISQKSGARAFGNAGSINVNTGTVTTEGDLFIGNIGRATPEQIEEMTRRLSFGGLMEGLDAIIERDR
jgi:hypothetical protein